MSEQATSVVEEIRKRLAEGAEASSNMPEEVLFIPTDGVKTVRFLSEFSEPVSVIFHERWGEKGLKPQPCLKYYQQPCPYHSEDYREGVRYVWTVYDYESEAKRLLIAKPTGNSVIDDLLAQWDDKHTLLDRDVKITRRGKGKNTKYRGKFLDPAPFEGKFRKSFSQEKIFEILKGMIKTPAEGDAGESEEGARPSGATEEE